ncbi:glycosyltransferase family 4 protein [Candidatus Daviesbacteria bacterium]|nr:glycosyltransferase family 4 protein [Candidatus Daviesbacteria bacterium]
MKIFQIAPAWMDTPPKNHGGTEWVIANLITGLSSLGHDVTLFATEQSHVRGKLKYVFWKSFLEQGIDWNMSLPALIHYFEAFKIASKYDIVHAHLSSETDMIIMPFLAELTRKRIPNIMTVHSRWPFDRHSSTDEMFLKLYANKIFAVDISASMHKTLPRQFRDGVFVHNSLDITKMKFNPKAGTYLTWLGKIIPEKGTVEAIKTAKKTGEQFIFAGVVDKYLETSVRYFKDKVKPLIDGDQIQYLGPADLKLKNKLLGGAKAFLNPISWHEPFGMVILESMACGTPVISYNYGAVSELIVNNKTGYLVRGQGGILKAIKKIDSIDRRDCREHVANNFSPQAAALKYLEIYLKEISYHQRSTSKKIKPSHNGHHKPIFRYPQPVLKLESPN